MASMEPSEDEVSQVVDFAGLNPVDDRIMIINALRNNNRNVETVVMQYFDNSESFRQKYALAWNDSMFSADRDGTAGNNAGISFHIESLEGNDIVQGVTPPPPSYPIGAPSRPPSRSNNRSPLGNMIDWAAGDAAAGPTMNSQEEDDMQRALRESAEEAGFSLPPQESGVMDHSTSTPYFGPANRSDYDQSNWAMVPVAPLKAKLPGAPTPSQRKRDPEVPAFIVTGSTSVGNHSLGGLLTILHEIPLARNILLQCGAPAASYGFNSQWWNGQEILPPNVLREIQTENSTWGDGNYEIPKANFEEEIHRLMAFLDSTERSYGTVNTLTELLANAHNGVERAFYERLGYEEILAPLYQEASLVNVGGDDVSGKTYDDARFGLLVLDHRRPDYTHIKTLYEALDYLMWGDVLSWADPNETSRMAMFQNMGEVFVIKVGAEGPPESFEIPEVFYPERYLASRKEEARRIMSAWCKTKNDIDRVTTEERRLQEWHNDWNQLSLDKSEMIAKAKEQWQVFFNYLETAGQFQGMEASAFDINKYPDYRTAPCQMTDEQVTHSKQVNEVLLLTERILSDIETRTEDLRAQLEQIQAKQRFLGRLLTKPEKPGRPKPMTCKKYLLRGIATDKDIVYVCQRVPSESAGPESSDVPTDQWWRLELCTDEDQPVKSEKIDIERILKSVWYETKTPLLLYATEEAVSTPKAPLSDALNMFAKSDNKAFRQELRQPAADTREERVRVSVDAFSPSKRKHRDSMDSMDSNRASIGSEDRDPFASVFDGQLEEAQTEMIDMSGSTVEHARGSEFETKFGDHGVSAQMNAESATLTPDTLAADEGEAQRPTPPSLEVSQPNDENNVMDESMNKGPEMQERARPLTLVRPSQATEGGKDLSMDMEIPDVQD
ncbi:hypothetical protein TGAM01_v204412 [Trichoderma gamsii]|uniref:Ubiquitin interaction domain-containing protein n=1 Tax=Trichoderma gamsii TaxID=398673 RepID=A0A2P4ZRK7_9HYPO|nr:hypothetical protein TGAM01_v204412 [Trichoderma gamsii]PON26911.1 hypothetical protein TGAM01_v204412 [Trichoderma gamsii]